MIHHFNFTRGQLLTYFITALYPFFNALLYYTFNVNEFAGGYLLIAGPFILIGLYTLSRLLMPTKTYSEFQKLLNLLFNYLSGLLLLYLNTFLLFKLLVIYTNTFSGEVVYEGLKLGYVLIQGMETFRLTALLYTTIFLALLFFAFIFHKFKK